MHLPGLPVRVGNPDARTHIHPRMTVSGGQPIRRIHAVLPLAALDHLWPVLRFRRRDPVECLILRAQVLEPGVGDQARVRLTIEKRSPNEVVHRRRRHIFIGMRGRISPPRGLPVRVVQRAKRRQAAVDDRVFIPMGADHDGVGRGTVLVLDLHRFDVDPSAQAEHVPRGDDADALRDGPEWPLERADIPIVASEADEALLSSTIRSRLTHLCIFCSTKRHRYTECTRRDDRPQSTPP